MNDSDKYFREKDIKEFLEAHYCVVSADGTQLLFADDDVWRDMLNALPAYTRWEIADEVVHRDTSDMIIRRRNV